MIYRGKVRNGVIVLNGRRRLMEGTIVRIEPVKSRHRARTPRPGSPEAIALAVGAWAGQDDDMERSLEQLRQMKAQEARRQALEPVPEL